MHGRIKVKTSAEQAEAKRKEKEKKAKAYLALCKDFLAKHSSKEYTEENLKLCSSLLELNPDLATGWNFRKEAFLHLAQSRSEEDIQSLAKVELSLTEACLRSNPKSYCVWIHRIWILKHCPSPDWTTELDHCQLALKLDERNFHCWDHRREVCREASVPSSDELDFSMRKISANFSNHSAWHYRSKLLPQVEDLATDGDAMAREISLVENAVFTDPADQSAWLYLRWLAGVALGKPQRVCLVSHSLPGRLLVQLSLPMTEDQVLSQLQLLKNGSLVPGVAWKNVLPADPASPLWEAEVELTEGELVALKLDAADGTLTCSSGETVKAPDDVVLDPHGWVTQMLNVCQQLHDMEPDCKYPLLMAAELMEESRTLADIEGCYNKLQAIDPKRTNLYRDRISRVRVLSQVETWMLGQPLSMASLELTSLPSLPHLATLATLDLSHNLLTSLHPLRHLVSLRTLHLDSNLLHCLQGLEGLRWLQELYLRDNQISDTEELGRLSGCKQLHTLALENNPAASFLRQAAQQILPQVTALL